MKTNVSVSLTQCEVYAIGVLSTRRSGERVSIAEVTVALEALWKLQRKLALINEELADAMKVLITEFEAREVTVSG